MEIATGIFTEMKEVRFHGILGFSDWEWVGEGKRQNMRDIGFRGFVEGIFTRVRLSWEGGGYFLFWNTRKLKEHDSSNIFQLYYKL